MKIIFIKKLTACFVVFLIVFSACFILNRRVLNVSATYFSTARLVPIYSVKTDENKVAISFDAAWGADKTREIMNICDSYGVKATFFLVGFWIEKYSDMVKEIYNRGFEIGIHSNTHPDMTKLSSTQIKDELLTNIKLVEELTGYTPKVFRPPYGYYNNTLIKVCEKLGLSCIEWSVDSLDWKGISSQEIFEKVIANLKFGDIILMHNNSDNILAGLKLILEYFKLKKYQAVPVGELIYYDNFKITNLGEQIKL